MEWLAAAADVNYSSHRFIDIFCYMAVDYLGLFKLIDVSGTTALQTVLTGYLGWGHSRPRPGERKQVGSLQGGISPQTLKHSGQSQKSWGGTQGLRRLFQWPVHRQKKGHHRYTHLERNIKLNTLSTDHDMRLFNYGKSTHTYTHTYIHKYIYTHYVRIASRGAFTWKA